MEVFLYSVPVTRRACAIIFEAARHVDKSTLPSPVSEFLTSEELEAHLNHPVRNGHPEDSFIDTQSTPRPSQPTFRWLLTQYNPDLGSEINFKALTAVLATASAASHKMLNEDGVIEVCDGCLQDSPRLINECRGIHADDLEESLGLPFPTCTNCFAAGKTCTWEEAEQEASIE